MLAIIGLAANFRGSTLIVYGSMFLARNLTTAEAEVEVEIGTTLLSRVKWVAPFKEAPPLKLIRLSLGFFATVKIT